MPRSKILEEQKKENLSALYIQILDAIHDLVLVKGEKSRIIWANKAFCDYYGMTNKQLKDLIDSAFSEPDYTQQYVKDDAYVFTTGSVLSIPQEPVVRFDGVVRLFHTVKSPLFDSSGKVVMTVGVSRDVTDRVIQEKLILDQQSMMIGSAKMASLGEMAAEIAHEIKNPLSAILLKTGFLKLKAKEGNISAQTVLEVMDQIDFTAKRIEKVIHGLQFFSRGGEHEKFQPALLKEILDETISFCLDRFKKDKVLLEVDCSPEIIIECHPVEISQVLLNLLNNALDATQGALHRWVKVHVFDRRDYVEMHVVDSGSGIPNQVVKKIFNPFFTTKPMGKGTGLGLSLSKTIVERHHGTINVQDNAPNTCFIIVLPKTHSIREMDWTSN